MPAYINPNNYVVHLTGPDGVEIVLNPRQKQVLDVYFERYRAKGFIKRLNEVVTIARTAHHAKIRNAVAVNKPRKNVIKPVIPVIIQPKNTRKTIIDRRKQQQRGVKSQSRVSRAVGKRISADANKLLQANLREHIYPISNNIGVGILSYNRVQCLRRLVDSILTHTDLTRTTLIISDDASTDEPTKQYLDELTTNSNMILLRNTERLGIAGNSNRLLRCLSRFSDGIILNDDTEVLQCGWDTFYRDAMRHTNMHHFLYRQDGIYGAKPGEKHSKAGINLRMVQKKPHGAVLAFTKTMLDTCGYFDESYGFYGMEHVDWSQKPWEFGLQSEGFWDVEHSDKYFKIHNTASAIADKGAQLRESRKVFKSRSSVKLGPSERSRLPEISYVIPFRNISREKCIQTVINNIRAQRYPVIHIIIVEQDNTKIDAALFHPVSYYHAPAENPLFNKALAFNTGVSHVATSSVVLHDADIMVQGNYTTRMMRVLADHDACHLGHTVIYADPKSTDNICALGTVDISTNCDRVVGYFEGGSLACKVQTYWDVGAFSQDFWGYGCEDCDFYERLGDALLESRTFSFLHLWHGRTEGWGTHHKINKRRSQHLSGLSINRRVEMQRECLVTQGWGKHLEKK